MDIEYSCGLSELRLSPKTTSTLFALMSRMRFGNCAFAQSQELADVTKLPVSRVSEALGELVRFDLALKLGRGEWLVNPAFIWCGQADGRQVALSRYLRAKQRQMAKAASAERERAAMDRKIKRRRGSLRVLSGGKA